VRGTSGVGVKSCNPWRTTSGEGVSPERTWRQGTKARGTNRIRYPGSPSRKRYSLGVGNGATVVGAVGKPWSEPPGKYGRKAET